MIVNDNFFDFNIHFPTETLLLNIETTGLSPRNSFICMIGLAWEKDHQWQSRALLAENKMDERNIMEAFYEIFSKFSCILTYGGQSFIDSFINKRWKNYSTAPLGIEEDIFENKLCIDIQKEIAPYREQLGLVNLKKYTAENFIGFHRKTATTSKDLIRQYHQFELAHDNAIQENLMAHHQEDIESLLYLSHFLDYTTFFHANYDHIISWESDDTSITFKLKLSKVLHQTLHYETEFASITLDDYQAIISVALFNGELKYFLPGAVKDYYYLPEEDRAIHKSVALYVDKSYRQKATSATCYIRQMGAYLPTRDKRLTPHFQMNYGEKIYYIPYEPEKWQENLSVLEQYIASIIK